MQIYMAYHYFQTKLKHWQHKLGSDKANFYPCNNQMIGNFACETY